jgi:alkylation response protein AidB-like acyl-CoA dehydrogenase
MIDIGRPDPKRIAAAKWCAVQTGVRVTMMLSSCTMGYGLVDGYDIEGSCRDAKVVRL